MPVSKVLFSMQRPQSSTYKDDLDSNLCALKTPIFRNFFHNYSTGNFSRKWKKHVFFTTAAAPYGRLMENPLSYVCRGHFSKSQREATGKLNLSNFLQRAKREIISHDKCPLADDLRTKIPSSTPSPSSGVTVRSFILIG